jgi:hypothetical protein
MSLFITTLEIQHREIFVRLEEKVTDISHNMSLLMVALARKLGPLEKLEAQTQRSDQRGNWEIMKT